MVNAAQFIFMSKFRYMSHNYKGLVHDWKEPFINGILYVSDSLFLQEHLDFQPRMTKVSVNTLAGSVTV